MVKKKLFFSLSFLLLGLLSACNNNNDSSSITSSNSEVSEDTSSSETETSSSSSNSNETSSSEAHEHSFNNYQIVKEPTLTTTGEASGTCECGETNKIELPILTDTSVWSIKEDVKATCEEDGHTTYTSTYGDVTITSSKLNHDYGSWTITSNPTLNAIGKASHTCKNDATHVEEVDIPALSDTSVWSVKEEVKPTEEHDGHTTYTSTYGDVTVVVSALQHTHNFGEWSISLEPTLTSKGKIKRVCKANEAHFEEEEIASLSDTSVWSVKNEVKPTCEKDGSTTYTSTYGDVTITISKLNHNFGAWTFTKEPTTSEGGTAKRVCANDSTHIEEVKVPALTDTSVWSIKEDVKAACESDGHTTYTSTYSDVTITINKLGHDYGAWTITSNPTLNSKGKASHTCKNDASHVEVVDIPALTDTSIWTVKNEVKATCEKDGSATYTSTYGEVSITTSKLGHNFGAWTFTKEPTTSEGGTAKRVCANDNSHTEEVNVPALTDTTVWTIKENVKATCEENGHTIYTSTYGDVTISTNKLGHAYPQYWTVVKQATLTEEGTAQKVCSNDSSHVLTADIPVLTDSSVWTKETKKAATCQVEGLDEYVSIYGIVQITTDKIDHVYSDYKVKDVTFGETATIYRECESGHETLDELTVAAPKRFSIAITDKTNNDIVKVVLNSNYPMVYDSATSTWTTTNIGLDDTSSSLGVVVKYNGSFEFDVVISSETDRDKFTYYGEAPISGEVSKHVLVNGVNASTNTYTFTYSKDGSDSKGTDKVILSNFVFITEEIPTGYPIDYKIIRFNTNGGKEVNPIVVCKNNAVDNLDSAITTKDGYEFGGWYYDSSFKTPFYAQEGVSESTTLYAKWNKLHDVKLVYNNGTADETIKIADGKELDIDNPVKSGYLFEGWYTNSSFTSASKYNNTPITSNITFYANYVKAPYFIGDYNGINERNTDFNGPKATNKIEEGKVYYRTLSINNDYTILTGKSDVTNWSLTSYDDNTNILVSDDNSHYYYYKTKDGVIFVVCDSASKKDTICDDDFYIYVMSTSAEFVSVMWKANNTNTYLYRVVEAKVNNHTINIFVDGVNNKVYFDVNILNKNNESVTVNDVWNEEYIDFIKITDENGVTVNKFANKNGVFTELDGYEGEYTNETIGSFSINGIGTITVGGNNYEYVIENNLIYATINGKLTVLKVNKTNDTATIEEDGYKATLKGASGDLVLDGYGNAKLDGKVGVYTVNLPNLTLTIDGKSTTYNVNFDEKTYFTKSIFSGHTFKGTYYSDWYEYDYPIRIIFDDTPEISGVLYSGPESDLRYYFYFTGAWDADSKELTLTFTNCITSNANGKQLVFKVEGNKLTAISGWSANCYEFTTKCSLTSTTFSL